MTQLFHPLLALIASATDKELARYVEFLKEENKILRARVPTKQIHTTAEERRRLMELGFLPGASVTAAQGSPLGHTRVFRVDGSEVALRRETAAHLVSRTRPPAETP